MGNRVPYNWGQRHEYFREVAHRTPRHSDKLQMRIKVYATSLYAFCCGYKVLSDHNQDMPEEHKIVHSSAITRVFLIDLHTTIESGLRDFWRRLKSQEGPFKVSQLLQEFVDELGLGQQSRTFQTFEALTQLRNTMHNGFVPNWDYHGRIGALRFEITKGKEVVIPEGEFDTFVDEVVAGVWDSALEFDNALALKLGNQSGSN